MTTSLIACGILKAEVEAALSQRGLSAPVFYLAPAPCVEPKALLRQLRTLLDRAAQVSDDIVVLIGRCHPELDEILASYPARRATINDCFDALLGEERKLIDRESNTFYTSTAWLDHWQRALRRSMQWGQVDARQNFGHYDRILLLDAGLKPVPDEKILEYFDYLQVPVEPHAITLDALGTLLSRYLGYGPQDGCLGCRADRDPVSGRAPESIPAIHQILRLDGRQSERNNGAKHGEQSGSGDDARTTG